MNSGEVQVYERFNDSWIQVGNDINGNEGDFSSFVSISYDGSIIAVGSPFSDSNGSFSGVVRVYQNQGGDWNQIGEDISGKNSGDLAGDVSLSDDGTILAIGSEENSDNGFDSGRGPRVGKRVNPFKRRGSHSSSQRGDFQSKTIRRCSIH